MNPPAFRVPFLYPTFQLPLLGLSVVFPVWPLSSPSIVTFRKPSEPLFDPSRTRNFFGWAMLTLAQFPNRQRSSSFQANICPTLPDNSDPPGRSPCPDYLVAALIIPYTGFFPPSTRAPALSLPPGYNIYHRPTWGYHWGISKWIRRHQCHDLIDTLHGGPGKQTPTAGCNQPCLR